MAIVAEQPFRFLGMSEVFRTDAAHPDSAPEDCGSASGNGRLAVRFSAKSRSWGRVAQLGERCVRNAEVASSILAASTILRS